MIPAEAGPWVDAAVASSGLPREYVAAMMSVESSFRPDVFADDVNGGTWGLLQLNREEWSKLHPEGADLTPPEGITDPMTHAELGGRYLKNRLETVRRYQADHPDLPSAALDELDALVIAHNAGEGRLLTYPDIPRITRDYLDKMHALTGCSPGRVEGVLEPPLTMGPDGWTVDIPASGIVESDRYERWQCTWWAASRRAHIGRPIDGRMGDAHMWRDSASGYGWPVGKDPRPGDVMVLQPGVLGASDAYGHVAVVEQVRADGSILVSESGALMAKAALREITVDQFAANRDGIDFIH